MGEMWKRTASLFIWQLPAFFFVYSLLPGSGIWIIVGLIVWFLLSMTWFAVANREAGKKWLYFPLACIIAAAGQFLSWIGFLAWLFHGEFRLFPS